LEISPEHSKHGPAFRPQYIDANQQAPKSDKQSV